jgi:hypothetical protein
MMKKYKISVIVPVFNAEDRLVPLLENLFSQNGTEGIEFIFIDDHSTDKSCRVQEQAAGINGDVRLLRMEKNCGPAACRNLPLSGFRTLFMGKGELTGHSGTPGSFAFYYPLKDLHFTGDMSQLTKPGAPIQLVMRPAITCTKYE